MSRLYSNENFPFSGIIACTFDPDFRALAHRIHTAIQQQPQFAGELIRINRPAL